MIVKFFLTLLFSISLFANERIVTLAPSINEIVYAIGMGDKVVANDSILQIPRRNKKSDENRWLFYYFT